MKRLKLLVFALLLVNLAFAGGIVTNTNQSAAYVRMLARDASTDVDAVFYNPAGLTKLSDGFYVQLNNQVISQQRDIFSDNMMLNEGNYKGEVFVPFFPSAYFAYKTGDWAFSGGFNVIGGGGGAKFDEGLPSFELPYASLPYALSDLSQLGYNVQGYDVDINFEGTSAYMGFQAGASYAINDMISVYLGARYVTIMNSYSGTIQDVQLNVNGTMVPASEAFGTFAGTFNALAAQTQGAGDAMQPLIDGGAGAFTLDQLLGAGQISQAQYDQLTGGLATLGVPNPGSLPAAQAQGTYYAASDEFSATGTIMTGYGTQMGDREVDVEQTGSGITPIIGANIALMEDRLNIGLKYEFATKMDIENNTTIDETGMFPDGVKTAADMPAFLSVGVDYRFTDNFKASVGYHYYWDRSVDYGKNGYDESGDYLRGDNSELLDKNSYEFALGLQYDINTTFGLSLGYLNTGTYPTLDYQSELSYTLNTNTVSLGGVAHITDNFDLDLGFLYTKYEGAEVPINNMYGSFTQTYDKSNWVAAIGLTYKFGE